ncbi:MAG: hypothetical protein M3Y85_00850, partial [Bacteroidota bacterium]|nr:hypothetical protein [Bacteroidota bacterium]
MNRGRSMLLRRKEYDLLLLNSTHYLPCLFSILFFLSCSSKKTDIPPLFTLLDSTGITFRNDVKDSKADNSFLFRNFYNGGGVAIADINNDGLPDVVFTS